MSSWACTYCLDAGYIRCLYSPSVQSNLPVCEDEMAMQDLLDFDSKTGSGYNGNCYAWKDLDVTLRQRSRSVLETGTPTPTPNRSEKANY